MLILAFFFSLAKYLLSQSKAGFVFYIHWKCFRLKIFLIENEKNNVWKHGNRRTIQKETKRGIKTKNCCIFLISLFGFHCVAVSTIDRISAKFQQTQKNNNRVTKHCCWQFYLVVYNAIKVMYSFFNQKLIWLSFQNLQNFWNCRNDSQF